MSCPQCGESRKISEKSFNRETGDWTMIQVDEPTYKRGERGDPDYISRRCSTCYDKEVARQEGSLAPQNH